MEKYKKSYKSNKYKISNPKWNEEFELPDRSYSISYIQDYFKKTVNHSIRFYVNTLENRIMFEIKTGYLKLLTPETIKLLGSIKSNITKDKNDKNIPHLEVTISSIDTF